MLTIRLRNGSRAAQGSWTKLVLALVVLIGCVLPVMAGAAVTLEGFVPGVGTGKDVVASGNYAYVASAEFGLSVVDVSNPLVPIAIGGASPAFYGAHVALSGTLAAVASGSMGINFVDVSDVGAPSTVASMSGMFNGVARAGQYAYALQTIAGNPSHTDLVVIDLTTPATPSIVGHITVADDNGIKIAGNFVYIAGGSAGLQIVNVSSPTAPTIVKTLDTPGTANGVAIAGNYAYVADSTSMKVVNIQTPGSATIVASLSMSAASAVAVSGSRLYVLDGTNLKVVNITIPTSPVLLGSVDAMAAQNLDAVGNTAYLASPSGGLYIVDATVPVTPVVLSNVYGIFGSAGMAVSGSLAVAGGGLYAGMKVIDISDPNAPLVRGSVDYSHFTAGYGIYGVALAGNYAYALWGMSGNPGHFDLVVVDISNPDVPVVVPGAQLTLAGGSDIKFSGGFLYVACGNAGLQIVDVTTPTNPHLARTTLDTPGIAKGVYVANGYAYVADNTSIQVFDVHTPRNASFAGSYSTSIAAASAVAVAGDRLFVIDGTQLKIFDVSTPSHPTFLGAGTSYGAQAIDTSSGLVDLAMPYGNHTNPEIGGLFVVDVSNPTQQQLVSQITVPGVTHAVAATGTFVYAGDSAAVVDIGHITVPPPTATPPSTATPTQTPTRTNSATPTATAIVPTATATSSYTAAPPTPTATVTPTTYPPSPFGSFRCYNAHVKVGTTKFTPVLAANLADRFGTQVRDLHATARLCNRANLNGEDPSAPTQPDHLTGYTLHTPPQTPAFVQQLGLRMYNQFGQFSVDVLKLTQVLIAGAQSRTEPPPVPSPQVDSFDCYKVRLTHGASSTVTLPLGATVEDEFGTLLVNLKSPTMLCVPVDRDETAPGADRHTDLLTCYRATAAHGSPKFTKVTPVFMANPVQQGTLEATKAVDFCVPTQQILG